MSAPKPAPATGGELQIAIVIVVFALLLNAGFYFLSGFYFDDKRQSASMMGTVITDGDISSVRLAFALMTAVIGALSIAAVFYAKWVAHGIAGLAGIASLLAAYFSFMNDKPGVLSASLFILGFMFPLLAVFSLLKSRGAWAFLVSLSFVLGTVLLFGAPKVKTTIGHGLSLWHAFILPGVLLVAGIAFSTSRSDYREPT